ncbi:tetratricopeptide repeat protein [Streptomyces sp. NPDC049910]|uniref:tetratricopeptide repeat protein n=1 Tax=Streptomyces sp. NPDC049910 TaxID=3155278 RepID=UPI00342589AB
MSPFSTQVGDNNITFNLLPPEHREVMLRQKLDVWDDLPTKTGPAPSSPAALLNAHRAVVPFRGRGEELGELRAWCETPGHAVRLLYGPGGQGKTRLARRLTDELAGEADEADEADEAWTVLWLAHDAVPTEFPILRYTSSPLLVVVDNAETRADQLAVLLRTAVHAARTVRFKVLLLARTRGDWWAELPDTTECEELEEAPAEALEPLAPDPEGYAEAYREAIQGLARALPEVPGQPGDWRGAVATCLSRFSAPTSRTPDMDMALTVHMTALVDLLDAAHAPGSPGRGPVERRLLGYERRYWSAIRADLGLKAHGGIESVLAAAFLCGAPDRGEAEALLRRVPVLDGQSADTLRAVRDWISALYPPPTASEVWGTLRPDRLAEYFVGCHLRDDTGDPRLADRLLVGATEAQATRLVTLHTRSAAHPAHRGHLDGELVDLCVRHPAVVGPIAVDVATQVERPEPLVSALDRLTDDPDAAPADLMRLLDRLPRTTHTLAPWALRLTERVTGLYRELAEQDPVHLPELARLMRRLCGRLREMGNRSRAYELARETARLTRPLAEADPQTFRPHLAASLHNLSLALGDTGRHAEAMGPAYEAVGLYRDLVSGPASESDIEVYRSELAYALNAVANAEGELGHPDKALTATREAVGIRRELVEGRDDAPAQQRAELADGLNNLSNWQSRCGKYREALESSGESAETYRGLAQERSDAFRAGLARSLGTYSDRLRDTGQYAKALRAAEEALGIRRHLAQARPDTYLPDLALALNSLAIDLGELGRLRESVRASAEAVDLFRALYEQEPAAFAERLAMSLNTHANQLDDIGRPEDALIAARESVSLYRPLAGGSPEAHTADLAMSLHTYAGRLHAMGHEQEALDTTRESVGLYRSLAEERPEVFLRSLVSGLNSLAQRLGDAGLFEESLDAAEEGVGLARRLRAADDTPPVVTVLAMLLATRAGRLYVVSHARASEQDARKAVQDAREAEALLRELVREDCPDAEAHAPQLAKTLSLLGVLLSGDGRREEALEAAAGAVDIFRRLVRDSRVGEDGQGGEDGHSDRGSNRDREEDTDGSAQDTAPHTPRLVTALTLLGQHLSAAGRHDEAAEALLEALPLSRKLARTDPAGGLVDLVLLLASLGEWLMAAGRRSEALPVVEEVVTLLDGPLDDTPVREALLGTALAFLGALQHGAGREDAEGTLWRAVEVSEDLAAADPAREPVFLHAVHALGLFLIDSRRGADEGRALLVRATRLARRLAVGDFIHEPLLAWALASLGYYPTEGTPRRVNALETTTEAVALSRRLAQLDPVHERLLLWALTNHLLRLAEAGEHAEALRTAAETTALGLRLTDARPAAYEPQLALARYASAKARLLADAEPEQARHDITEALAVYHRLAQQEPGLVAATLEDAEKTRRHLFDERGS